MPKFYTSAILLIDESKEICEKQISVFCSKWGHFCPLMHVPLWSVKTWPSGGEAYRDNFTKTLKIFASNTDAQNAKISW